jgi:exodeoxyribonuclease-3
VKIATYNVNGINGRLANLLDWLAHAKPDAVALQELKAPDERFPAAAIEAAGYGAVWHGQKSWNGVAILARGATPVETQRGLPDDPDPAQSRYLEAAVDGVLIGCVYLPNGNPWPGPKFDYKLSWFDAFARHAATLLADGLPVVLAGDYNVVPTDLDIYRPGALAGNALVQPEPRAAYSDLIEQGWTDALRTLHPTAPMFTFWDYFRDAFAHNRGMRLDHLLLSPVVAARLAAAGVDRDARARTKSSDHAPAWVELRPTPPTEGTT